MNNYRHSKASLFLMEIMLNILFFTVLATICLQLFVKAHKLSDSTTILHRATATCTSIAEVYQSNSDGKERILQIYPEAIGLEQKLYIYFDESFSPCTDKEGIYCASVSFDSDLLEKISIEFSNIETSNIIYTLEVSGYQPQTLSTLLGGEAHE